MISQLASYGIAALGPISLAVTQFLLSLQMLRLLAPDVFGSFSFLLVVSQFLMGVSSALFCAPVGVLMASSERVARDNMVRALFATNLLFSIVTFLAIAGLALKVGSSGIEAASFGAYSAATMLRWFGRAHAYAVGTPLRSMASDVSAAATLAAAMIAIAVGGQSSASLAYFALLASGMAGVLALGRDFLRKQFMLPALADYARYREVWRLHSGWSLLGVVTTETTGNAHSYIVTLVSGGAAFAAIAASALITRPLTVIVNALTEFERPRFAQFIGAGHHDQVSRANVLFRLVLSASWLFVALAATALLRYAPRLVFPAKYDLGVIDQGSVLWMAVMIPRMIRAPESAALQAAGAFRWLAYASVISSCVTLVAVPILLVQGGPIRSILGILAGEMVFTFAVLREAKRWRAKKWRHAALPQAN